MIQFKNSFAIITFDRSITFGRSISNHATCGRHYRIQQRRARYGGRFPADISANITHNTLRVAITIPRGSFLHARLAIRRSLVRSRRRRNTDFVRGNRRLAAAPRTLFLRAFFAYPENRGTVRIISSCSITGRAYRHALKNAAPGLTSFAEMAWANVK